jgi:hypothetical protein
MVVEIHAIVHPTKTSGTLCVDLLFPSAATTPDSTAQTMKQPMLYAQ